jgi:hypothetical protein
MDYDMPLSPLHERADISQDYIPADGHIALPRHQFIAPRYRRQ